MDREYNELVGARLLYPEVAGCLSRHLELISDGVNLLCGCFKRPISNLERWQ